MKNALRLLVSALLLTACAEDSGPANIFPNQPKPDALNEPAPQNPGETDDGIDPLPSEQETPDSGVPDEDESEPDASPGPLDGLGQLIDDVLACPVVEFLGVFDCVTVTCAPNGEFDLGCAATQCAPHVTGLLTQECIACIGGLIADAESALTGACIKPGVIGDLGDFGIELPF